jgi:glycosyltransferase involved in cell wall biosynthesis
MNDDLSDQPQISIIVPVYQVENYIEDCLDSLTRQTYPYLEIIAVNDGSTDGSVALVEKLAQDDARIHIVHKENGGLSSARNAGIKAARGRIIMFVDSDDMLTHDACQKVAKAFENPDAEIVTFGGEAYPPEAGNYWLNKVLSPRNITYAGFDPNILIKESSRPFVWRTALTAEFLKRTSLLFDEEVAFGEDQIFHFMAYPQARCTVLIGDHLYLYRQNRSGSLMQDYAFKQRRRLIEHQNIARAILEGWQQHGWLERWPQEIFSCMLDFLIYDINELEGEERQEFLHRLSAMLTPFLAGRDLNTMKLKKATRTLLQSITQESQQGIEASEIVLQRKQMALFYAEYYGKTAALKTTLRRVRERLPLRQILKFGVVGTAAFIIDYTLLIFLTEVFGINYLLSATISFTVAVIANYLASMRFVFKHKRDLSKRKGFAFFVAGSVIGLGINNLGMWFGVSILMIDYRITKLVVTIAVMAWNFITRKVFLDES